MRKLGLDLNKFPSEASPTFLFAPPFIWRRVFVLPTQCGISSTTPTGGTPNNSLTADHLAANGVPIPGSGSFGTITSLNANISMRELQLSVRLIF